MSYAIKSFGLTRWEIHRTIARPITRVLHCLVGCGLFQRNTNRSSTRLNALRFKQVHSGVPMGSNLVQSELKSNPFGSFYIGILLTSACRQAHTHRNRPPQSLVLCSRTCPVPNWWFFFQRGDYVCMCLEARRLDSVHLQHQRGQKRHPFLLLGRGAIDTNKPPPTSSPVCWGYVRNVLGPIVPLVLCFW